MPHTERISMAVLPWSHLLSFSGLSSPYCVTAPECSNPPDGAGQTHTLTYIHKDAHTHTQSHTLWGRFTHFLFTGWHRSPRLVTYTETIMSFLPICLSPSVFFPVSWEWGCLEPPGSYTTRAMFANSPNENVSQQSSRFMRIVSWLQNL